MDPDDLVSSWTMIEKQSDVAVDAYADASMSCLSQNQPRQALQNLTEGIKYLSWRTIARSDFRFKKPKLPRLDVKPLPEDLETIHSAFDPKFTADVEADLAKKDAEASAAIAANETSITQRLEPEQYSYTTTDALHKVFYESALLPCNCTHPKEPFDLMKQHACVLRLNGSWDSAGNSSHYFFESVLGIDSSYDWKIQFRIPRKDTKVTLKTRDRKDSLVHAPKDRDTETSKGLDLEIDSMKDPDVHAEILNDICALLDDDTFDLAIPVQLEIGKHDYSFYQLSPVHIDGSPGDSLDPISLLRAIQDNMISVKSKILVAFTLAKYFWQFYSSNWMHCVWNLETIVLLPQTPGYNSLNVEAKTPFLSINTGTSEKPRLSETQELDPSYPTMQKRLWHPYPHILNLGLLLVLLGTKGGAAGRALNTLNSEYSFCKSQLKDKNWPHFDSSEQVKEIYRNAVRYCVPESKENIHINLAERRQMLFDKVTRPLFNLLQSMQDPFENEILSEGKGGLQGSREDTEGMDSIQKDPSQQSENWITKITDSNLYRELQREHKRTDKARPKIALIDTGYDPEAAFLRRKYHSNRLSNHPQYHWKDFCEENAVKPLDADGHGTSMLSLLMRLAPFADICVARIARMDQDLQGNQSSSSRKRLADAIRWAVDEHKADIVLVSLGWVQVNHDTDRCAVTSAITYAKHARDGNILFFASASNFGGGKHELFPARLPEVFSIRATDHEGQHCSFNASLPAKVGIEVYGTLGKNVPTAQRGKKEAFIARNGTSPATAIAAGIAALIIAYVNNCDTTGQWQYLKQKAGFEKLLDEIATRPETQKRFLTLENVYNDLDHLKSLMTSVCSKSRIQ